MDIVGLDSVTGVQQTHIGGLASFLSVQHPTWSYLVVGGADRKLEAFHVLTPVLGLGLRGWDVGFEVRVRVHAYCARCAEASGVYHAMGREVNCGHCERLSIVPYGVVNFNRGADLSLSSLGGRTRAGALRERLEPDLIVCGTDPLTAVLEAEALARTVLTLMGSLFMPGVAA